MTAIELCFLVKASIAFLSPYQQGVACRHADYIIQQSEKRGVNPLIVTAIIYRESAFSPRAVSHAGACGIMQVMPQYSKYTCEQLKQPRIGIKDGIRSLAFWLSWTKGDMKKSLCGYNAGTVCVKKPNSRLSKKVRRTYVKKVLDTARIMRLNRDKFNRISGKKN